MEFAKFHFFHHGFNQRLTRLWHTTKKVELLSDPRYSDAETMSAAITEGYIVNGHEQTIQIISNNCILYEIVNSPPLLGSCLVDPTCCCHFDPA